MDLVNLRKENEVLDIFCELAQIPSPSLKEEKVIEWIKVFCEKNSLSFRTDDYNNVYNVIIKISALSEDTDGYHYQTRDYGAHYDSRACR